MSRDHSICWYIVRRIHEQPIQCSRKRGYGPGGIFCKQHAKLEQKRHMRAKDKA